MATRYYFFNPYEPRSDIRRLRVDNCPTQLAYGTCELETDLSPAELDAAGYAPVADGDFGHYRTEPHITF